ncbi:MAG: hypothetical protein OXU26_17625 [Acidobacteriota bacterium]|nr:hypothetical protein [Acidobacteriota bacterium]
MNPNTPNLFEYATKELAQDAALAYILAWSEPAYRECHQGLHQLGTAVLNALGYWFRGRRVRRRLHRLGTAMLHALLATRIGESGVPTVTSVRVETQVDGIDLLVRINDENEEGLVLLVEDKLDTDEHSEQIARYLESARMRFPNREIVPVYVKTGNASLWRFPSEKECGRFLRRDLLDVLDRFPNTGNTVVDNFRAHLQVWEDETNSYRHTLPSKWNYRAMEGFYSELQYRMRKEYQWDFGDWLYVPNPAGGLLCFYFAENAIKRQPYETTMYLQIELSVDVNRLTVRLSEKRGPGIRAPLMYQMLELLKNNARHSDGIEVNKAGRFRGGASGAVAEVTFGDKECYLARKDGGIIDMEATIRRLDLARQFVSNVAHSYSD